MNNTYQMNNHFYIVRHGESENNILEIDCSTLQNKHLHGLTKKGKKSVEALASKHCQFDIVCTSPLRRTRETAEIFAKSSSCPVVIDERLIELHFGDFELCAYDASGITETHLRANKELRIPGGECFRELEERLFNFFDEINALHQKKSILIVTHGMCVEVFMEQFVPNFDWNYYHTHDSHTREVFPIAIGGL